MDGDLQAAQHAFERGDYAETRRRARSVLQMSDAPQADHEQARELLQRTRNDKVAIVLGLLCFLGFVAIFLSYAGKR